MPPRLHNASLFPPPSLPFNMAYNPTYLLPKYNVHATPAAGHTPVPPSHYTSRALVHNMDDYERLKHRAIAINADKMHQRVAHPDAWRKSALTDHEKYYLWNSQNGRCANTYCTTPLDERSMTIEHIIPKSGMHAGTWDIRNMTILCRSCNSTKGDRSMPQGMDYMASLAPRRVMNAIHKR